MGLVLLSLAVDSANAALAAERVTEHVSPDGEMTARVMAQGGYDCEARIEFRADDRQVAVQDYHSPDHEHGDCLGNAKWTPDGQFFVFSLIHAGGHMPWHTPILFFSRRSGRVVSLEAYVGDPVTSPEFKVLSPDVVEFDTTALPLDKHELTMRTVSLGALE
ncbi:MAG TPA: hypothetical protein VGD08_27335 [Stellaceae bacterium]